MKIRVLVDNNTYIDQYYCGEPAVSYYIEDGDTRLLLDVGYSDLFIKNALAFGIDLRTISAIVISHGHDDHTRGLKYYFKQNYNNLISIFAHPHTFKKKTLDNLKIGSPVSEEELRQKCNRVLSKEPVEINRNLTFLGEIPQLNEFEKRASIGKQVIDGNLVDDYIMDDSALVYKTNTGIYIITGCAHSGICNIVEYAKEVSRDKRVLGILGGFHLFEVSEKVMKTIDYLKKNNIKLLYPCHCTTFAVRAEIHKTVPIKEVGVGLELEW